MIITLDIPNYTPESGLETIWEYGFEIITNSEENNIKEKNISISANKAGLVSLAKHLLTLAQDDVLVGTHIHYDELNSLNEGSVELVIEKIG